MKALTWRTSCMSYSCAPIPQPEGCSPLGIPFLTFQWGGQNRNPSPRPVHMDVKKALVHSCFGWKLGAQGVEIKEGAGPRC